MGSVRWKTNPDGTVDEIHKVVVYKTIITLYDEEEYNNVDYGREAHVLQTWAKTQPATFIFEHCRTKLEIIKSRDVVTYQLHVAVFAELEKKKLSEFYLKWGNPYGSN